MPISSTSPFTMTQSAFAAYALQCYQTYPLYPIRDAYMLEQRTTDADIGCNVLGAMMYDQYGPPGAGQTVTQLAQRVAANLAAWGVPVPTKDKTNDWAAGVLSGWGEDYFDTSLNFVNFPPGYGLGQAARLSVKGGISVPPGF